MALKTAMQALEGVDASVIQSLASVGMQPGKLMALAFQELAENADKIGQLNITPDLLREMMQMARLTENKLILVRRKTRLEELLARFNTVEQARFYVEHLGSDFL